MNQIALRLEYDGTGYVGWQVQPNGPSVQAVVERALENLLGEPVRLRSSGRTDAGVHARDLVACFTPPRELPLSAYREGLNRLLPGDIAVREAQQMPEEFHPRFDAAGKWYRYQVFNAPVRSPLLRHRAWHIRGTLDVAAMALAAANFAGRHDFAAFRSSGCDAATTVREIFSVGVDREGELINFDVRGAGFLRNMVRVMVGTLVEIGLGRRGPGDVGRLLASRCREQAGRTAPAHGLCLMEVWYGAERRM
jgi:tRNA pseudouridine38-40 synthase